MNKNVKIKLFLISGTLITVVLSILLLFSKITPSRYLKKHDGTTAETRVNEILTQEEYNGRYIIFFLNEKNNVSCAILKKKGLSYKLLRISGELSPSKNSNNYLFSSYDDKNYEWIDWGLITDNDTEQVLSNDLEMNIIDNLLYGYRICWIIGKGENNTPPTHAEIKKAAQ